MPKYDHDDQNSLFLGSKNLKHAPGIALTLVPESSMLHSPKGVVFRRLDSDLPDIEIFALWRSENDSPLIQKFLDLIVV